MWPFKKKGKEINVVVNNSVFESIQEQRRIMAQIAERVVKEMAPGIIAEDYAKDGIIRQLIRNNR